MLKFREYLLESKDKEPVAPTIATGKEVKDFLGDSRFKSLLKNPFWLKYNNWEKIFKYSRDEWGHITIDVYPYFPTQHITKDGKIKPTIWLSFKWIIGNNVEQVSHYYRDGSDMDWKFMKHWKEVK